MPDETATAPAQQSDDAAAAAPPASGPTQRSAPQRVRWPAIGTWLRRWGVGCTLVVLLIAAVAASLLGGHPARLPAIALGSPALLYVEKATVFFASALVVLVVLVRGFGRDEQLPREVSKDGLRWEVREVQHASSEALAALEEAIVDLRGRLDEVETLEDVD